MEITGTIKQILPTQNVSSTFRKREVIVSTDENYPQVLSIEFVQDKVDLVERAKEGDKVTVSINLRGREWTNPQGEVKYFMSIQGWRIQAADASASAPVAARPSAAEAATYVASAAPVSSTGEVGGFAPVPDDDLPF